VKILEIRLPLCRSYDQLLAIITAVRVKERESFPSYSRVNPGFPRGHKEHTRPHVTIWTCYYIFRFVVVKYSIDSRVKTFDMKGTRKYEFQASEINTSEQKTLKGSSELNISYLHISLYKASCSQILARNQSYTANLASTTGYLSLDR